VALAEADFLAEAARVVHGKIILESRISIYAFFFFIFSLVLSFSLFGKKAVRELWNTRMHDEAHVLKQETIDQLEHQLAQYEDSTSNQIAILILNTLEGESIEDYSLRVAENWKLGQKEKDNGVLLLIAVNDHKMSFQVGEGLEDALTDAQSNRIIRNETYFSQSRL